SLLGYACLEPVTWTLQVEVLFYGIISILFAGGAMRNPARTLLWYLAVCTVMRAFLNVFAGPAGEPEFAFASWIGECLLIDYLPLFAVGMMIYELRRSQVNWRWNASCLFAAIAVFHAIDQRDHNPLVTVGLTVLLVGAAFGKIPVLRTRPLLYISTISYSLYLLHNNLGCVLIYHLNHWGMDPWICFALSLPLVIGLSVVASVWIEQPMSRYLRTCWDTWRAAVRWPGSRFQTARPTP
ncbi:MAG TPA: acyltransferase, partial [Pirellulaceae bacterium]|nr:acyltransferase [Pirellulaceae bacterium]